MLDLAPPVIIQDATVDQAVLNELFREGDIVLIATTVRFDPQIADHDGAVEMDAAKLCLYHVADHVFGLFLHGGGLILTLDGPFGVNVFV